MRSPSFCRRRGMSPAIGTAVTLAVLGGLAGCASTAGVAGRPQTTQAASADSGRASATRSQPSKGRPQLLTLAELRQRMVADSQAQARAAAAEAAAAARPAPTTSRPATAARPQPTKGRTAFLTLAELRQRAAADSQARATATASGAPSRAAATTTTAPGASVTGAIAATRATTTALPPTATTAARTAPTAPPTPAPTTPRPSARAVDTAVRIPPAERVVDSVQMAPAAPVPAPAPAPRRPAVPLHPQTRVAVADTSRPAEVTAPVTRPVPAETIAVSTPTRPAAASTPAPLTAEPLVVRERATPAPATPAPVAVTAAASSPTVAPATPVGPVAPAAGRDTGRAVATAVADSAPVAPSVVERPRPTPGTRPAPTTPAQPRPTFASTTATSVTSTPQPPAAGRWIKRVGKRTIVSVTFSADPLQDVLALFSSYSGLSIIPSDEKGLQDRAITGEIHQQPWYAALEALLDANGLRPVQDSLTGIVTVLSKQAAVEDRIPYIIRLRYVDAASIQPTLAKVVSEPAAGEGEAAASQRDAVDVVTSGNSTAPSRTLVVYTSPAKLEKVKEMVAMLDRTRPTVMISAKLASVNRSRMERLGFNYSIVPTPVAGTGGTGPGVSVTPIGTQYPGGAMPYPPMSGQPSSAGAFSFLKELALSKSVNLNLFLDVTQSVGLAEVQTAPSITVLTDEPAQIAVGASMILPTPSPIVTATSASAWGQPMYLPGQGVPGYPYGAGQPGGYPQPGAYPQPGGYPVQNGGYPVQNGAGQIYAGGAGGWGQFQTGTTLKVTPYVLEGGKVRMKLDITHDGSVLGPDGRTISGPKQSVQNEVIVNDNEILVIGGLTTVQRTNTETGVPVLSKLPLLGNLFKRTEAATINQDLVIIVQPHVMSDAAPEEPIIEALPAGRDRPGGTPAPAPALRRP